MCLKPELYEKCDLIDLSEHEDDETCNMDVFTNTEGQFTETLWAGINISEGNKHLTQTKITVLTLVKRARMSF